MKKKVLVSILIILLCLGIGLSYATENTNVITNSVDSDSILADNVVDTTSKSSTTAGSTSNKVSNSDIEESEDDLTSTVISSGNEEDYAIPEEWRRETQSNITQDDIFETGEDVEVKDKIVDGNGWIFGSSIDANNISMSGDLFIAGKDVTLSNINVFGNLYVAGETVILKDTYVTGNVYSAGKVIKLIDATANDLFVAGSEILVEGETQVIRNMNVVTSKIAMDSAKIGRDAKIIAEDIAISSQVTITGNLNYSSSNEANIASDSNIGNINYNHINKENANTVNEVSKVKSVAYKIAVVFVKAVFVCGFIYLFAEGFIKKQKVDNVAIYVGKNILKGILLAIIIPVIAVLLMCTGVAVGLGFVILALYFVVFAISSSLISITISTALTKNKELNAWKSYGITLCVAIAIGVLEVIPGIGGFITCIVGLTGMGIIFSAMKNKKVAKIEEEIMQ